MHTSYNLYHYYQHLYAVTTYKTHVIDTLSHFNDMHRGFIRTKKQSHSIIYDIHGIWDHCSIPINDYIQWHYEIESSLLYFSRPLSYHTQVLAIFPALQTWSKSYICASDHYQACIDMKQEKLIIQWIISGPTKQTTITTTYYTSAH